MATKHTPHDDNPTYWRGMRVIKRYMAWAILLDDEGATLVWLPHEAAAEQLAEQALLALGVDPGADVQLRSDSDTPAMAGLPPADDVPPQLLDHMLDDCLLGRYTFGRDNTMWVGLVGEMRHSHWHIMASMLAQGRWDHSGHWQHSARGGDFQVCYYQDDQQGNTSVRDRLAEMGCPTLGRYRHR